MFGPSPWENSNGSAEAIAQRGGGAGAGADLSGFERLWIAGDRAFKSLAPDTQFDANNDAIAAWDDHSAGAIRLLPGTGSPFGQVPWAAVGGADDASKAVVFRSNQGFATDTNAMSGMARAVWTIALRCHFGGNPSGVARFIGVNSTTWDSWHVFYDYFSKLIEIRSNGTDNGLLVFLSNFPQSTPVTILSRYDGVTHFGAVYDEGGVLIEALTTSHSGVIRSNNSFALQDGAVREMDVKKMVFYDRFMDDATAAALVANMLTDDIPA